MEEKMTRTSLKQRIIIGVIAVIMLGSSLAIYIALVLGNSASSAANAKLVELEHKISEKQEEANSAASALSAKYLDQVKAYKSEVKSYNATSANAAGLDIKDLKVGTGAEITAAGDNYFAYYIGWCADETVFDSSLTTYDNPTSLAAPIPGTNLIEGWKQGVVGMKIGGTRLLTIPGELAYGESREICGGTNSPLKFIVVAIEKDEKLQKIWDEIDDLTVEYQALYYSSSLAQ